VLISSNELSSDLLLRAEKCNSLGGFGKLKLAFLISGKSSGSSITGETILVLVGEFLITASKIGLIPLFSFDLLLLPFLISN
tara:strand:- start:68 stop:313 length:246 start_codon:yes stop_codon:yes gene_type:complete